MYRTNKSWRLFLALMVLDYALVLLGQPQNRSATAFWIRFVVIQYKQARRLNPLPHLLRAWQYGVRWAVAIRGAHFGRYGERHLPSVRSVISSVV